MELHHVLRFSNHEMNYFDNNVPHTVFCMQAEITRKRSIVEFA